MKKGNFARHKRSMAGTEAFWFGIILVSVFLLIMFGLVQKFKVEIEGNAYDEVCRQYLKMHMIGKQAYIDPKLDDIPCKTEYKTIKSTSKIPIMKDISKDMVECFNTFNRGKSDLFSVNASNTWNTFCAACYVLDFNAKNIQIDPEELIAFHTSKYNFKETYTDILLNDNFDVNYAKEKTDVENKIASYQRFSIDTNKKYMVLFKYQKLESNNLNNNIPDYFKKVVLLGGGGGAAVGVAAVVGVAVAVGATVLTAGAAAVVVVPIFAAGGMYLGYENIHSEDVYADGKSYYARSGIYLEEYSVDNLKRHKCDFIVGIQEPGVNRK